MVNLTNALVDLTNMQHADSFGIQPLKKKKLGDDPGISVSFSKWWRFRFLFLHSWSYAFDPTNSSIVCQLMRQ